MSGDPITRQRSPWEPVVGDLAPGLLPSTTSWLRRVHDGSLRALVAEEPMGWHLSISHVDHRGEPRRYPHWDEITHARDELLPDDVEFVMVLPVAADYVAAHKTTFHLHEHPERTPCTGATDCPADRHVHGCYAERGPSPPVAERYPSKVNR